MEANLPPRYALDTQRPVLGEGGMGRVLHAWDQEIGVPVALKVVRPDLAADHRFRKLFDLEVRVSARFTHDHIVPLHDLGELDDGTPFLGLAFADAGSFANLRDRLVPWEDLLRLTLELIEALAHLHARGVLHRDLKPENVLLHTGDDQHSHVWLADLGLANASSALAKRKGRVEGTPGFMAPEQKLGLPREYGPWTDLFSLGVILWELVTGELPYPSDRSPLDADLPPLLPRSGLAVPRGLEVVFGNLLAAEPLSRYDLAADLSTELQALGAPEVTAEDLREGAAELAVPRAGTVAPSASAFTTGQPLTEPEEEPADEAAEPVPDNTTFFDPEEIEDPASLELGVPVWNRPLPRPLPAEPPPEPGAGARARASVPLFAVRELPLVARDHDRRVLWEQVRAVQADGRSRVVLVVGEAGSGKTRLVHSVLRALEEGGWAETLQMTYQRPPGKEDGYAGAARSVIRPWNETRSSLELRLRRRLARERGAMAPGVEEEAATLARWCGLVEEGEEPIADGYGLREVYRYLEARTWRGLACLLLDDAQWAAEEGDGLAIAETVLRGVQDGERGRLVVFATLRTEDLAKAPGLADQVDALVEAGALRLDLPRLDRDGTRALLHESLTLTPALADRLAERCEGNPLFARQLLIEWVERGWLVDTGHLQFDLAEGVDADAVLPADAEALFRERVAALAEASGHARKFRDVVHMAAITGLMIPREIFRSLAGHDLYSFARACGLWTEKEEWVVFDHGLLHQAVRAEAEARDDVHYLHRRLARAWVRYGIASGTDVHLQVGRHAYGGRAWRMAIGDLLQASENAWRQGRTKELDEASALAVSACDQERRCGDSGGWARLWRGRSFQSRGDAQGAWVAFNEAQRIFEVEGNGQGVVESLLGSGWASRQAGDLSEAERRYGSAMRRARAAEDKRAEANAIAGLAWVEQQKRNFEGADILFTRVLNRFNQLEDWRGVAEATMGHAFVARRTGQFDDAEELYHEAIEAFRDGDDRLGVARAHHGLGVVLRQRLMIEEAEATFREAIRIAEELGATDVVMESRTGLAELHRIRGDHDRARALYEEHARWADRQKSFDAAIFAHLGLATVALFRDDLDAMHRHAMDASRYLGNVPGHWLWAPYRLTVATLLALRGDRDNTYRWLWSAAELGLDDIVDQDLAYLLTLVCHVAHGRRWVNTLRVAGKLAVSQLGRLGREDEAREILALVAEVRA